MIAALAVIGAIAGRRYAYFWIQLQGIETRQLSDLPDLLAPSETPFDDYYTIERLDGETFAIGEPRYWQQNYSYLILGATRAVLFDSGSHVRNIAPVVASLTALPVTVFPSHLHYDHVGNLPRFERIALLDLPQLRRRARDATFAPTLGQHLGFVEDQATPEWRIAEWWAPDQEIDLGGRVLRVLSTPGHTPESAMLYDAERGQLFAGDYLYEGSLYAFLPGSDLESYEATAARLLERLPESVRVFGAHRATAPGAPELARPDLEALHETLRRIRLGEVEGHGIFPVRYRVNDRLEILADRP